MLVGQVLYASECGIPFLASSGAHGFSTTLAALQNGMKIDMSLFRGVSVEAVGSTLTVGGGVLTMDVIDPLYKAGKEMSTVSFLLSLHESSFSARSNSEHSG